MSRWRSGVSRTRGAPRSEMPASVASDQPPPGRHRFRSVRMVSVRRIATDMGVFHHGGPASLRSGARPAVSPCVDTGQCRLRHAPAAVPNPDRRHRRYSPPGEAGAEHGSDSAAGWSYLSRGCSGSTGTWAHGSRAPRGALLRDSSAQPGTPHRRVVAKSFAPTRLCVGVQLNNPGPFIILGHKSALCQAIARSGDPGRRPAMRIGCSLPGVGRGTFRNSSGSATMA